MFDQGSATNLLKQVRAGRVVTKQSTASLQSKSVGHSSPPEAMTSTIHTARAFAAKVGGPEVLISQPSCSVTASKVLTALHSQNTLCFQLLGTPNGIRVSCCGQTSYTDVQGWNRKGRMVTSNVDLLYTRAPLEHRHIAFVPAAQPEESTVPQGLDIIWLTPRQARCLLPCCFYPSGSGLSLADLFLAETKQLAFVRTCVSPRCVYATLRQTPGCLGPGPTVPSAAEGSRS